MNKLFIFDLDGVLVDACEWHKNALNEALHKVCSYKISKEEHISTFNGIPTREKLKILSLRGIIDEAKHEEINNLKQERTIEIINQNATMSQEKIKMINFLKREGHLVCCYTNSIRKTATLMLEKTGIYKLFDEIFTNEDVEYPKPNPEGYIRLMEKFNVHQNDCFIIEDSPKGKTAAYESGANVIEVDGPEDVHYELIRRYI